MRERVRFDWQNMPTLGCPQRQEPRQPERLTKAKRNHKKRHGENRERSKFEKAKASRIKHIVSEHNRKALAFNAAVAAYWRGETDVHP